MAARSKVLDRLAVVLFALALFDFVTGLAQTSAWIALVEGGEPGNIRMFMRVGQLGSAAGLIVVFAFLISCNRGAVDGLNRGLWLGALVLVGFAVLEVGAVLLTEILDSRDPWLWRLYSKTWFRTIAAIARVAWIALILVAAARVVRKRSSAIVSIAAIVVLGIGFALMVKQVTFESNAKSIWFNFFVESLTTLSMIGAGLVCRWAAGVRGGPLAAGAAIAPGSLVWARAADGLRMYASALSWRLIVTIGGYLILLMAVMGKSTGLAKMMMWMMPLAVLVTGVLMFAGIVRFCAQPADSPGRAAAIFAAAAMGFALLLDFVGLVQVLQALSGADEIGGYRRSREALESAAAIAPWAMALSFGGLAALLFSFWAIANRLADQRLVKRTAVIGVWLIIIAVCAVALRTWIGDAGRNDFGTIAMLGLLVGIAALAVIVAYIGLVRDFESQLRLGTESTELPSARVVDQ